MYKQPALTSSAKRILICPLNWGLGHATRCIPIISYLTELGHEVIIAADGGPFELLRREFPKHESIRFPGPSPTYNSSGSQLWAIARQTPALLGSIVAENRFIRQQVSKLDIHAIISDNRYGAFHPDLPSVLITHQLQICIPKKLRLFAPPAQLLIHRLINNFDACWVPDLNDGVRLSGDLSEKNGIKIPVHYIGLLSRYLCEPKQPYTDSSEKKFVLAVLSGPEPQRSLFEQIVINCFAGSGAKLHLLRGLPLNDESISCPPNIQVHNYLDRDKMLRLFNDAEHIICRSGYSTLMDLIIMGKKAFLVPTPGQPEQEYLAKRMKQLRWFDSCIQTNFSEAYPGWKKEEFEQPQFTDVFALREHLRVWLDQH